MSNESVESIASGVGYCSFLNNEKKRMNVDNDDLAYYFLVPHHRLSRAGVERKYSKEPLPGAKRHP
jgi:hypothetical protein